jgi:hypothetical protein
VGEVFRALQHRLHDSTWTVVFKSLITTHVMIREGAPDVTLAYLAKHRNILAVSLFSDGEWHLPQARDTVKELTLLQRKPKVGTYATTRTTFKRGPGRIAIPRSTGSGQASRGLRSCQWTRVYCGRPRQCRGS